MDNQKPKNMIQKAETVGKKALRYNTQREKGQPRIVTSSHYIQDIKESDLVMPRRLCTFDNMLQDPAIYNAVDVTKLHMLRALSGGEFRGKKGSKASEEYADYLNYCIRNMSYGTWMEAMNDACTSIQYGFSILSITTERRNYGEYKGQVALKRLAPRNQHSIYGWVWDKNYRYLKGVVQKPMLLADREPQESNYLGGITALSGAKYYGSKYPYLKDDSLLIFSYDKTNNNPQGNSPLVACYTPWREKQLIERYEVVGVSKDLGGALVIRVPRELIEKAADPAENPEEYQEYMELQEDAASLHAGESSYMILSSDVDPNTKTKSYDIDFKGVDGGGKQYKTSDIIDQKRKAIYNAFGAGFLLLGQDSVGSYAMSADKTATHSYYVQRAVDWIVDVINNSLATRLLAANGMQVSWKDMPEFVAADTSESSLDEIGKFIQRVTSVSAMTNEALKQFYIDLGLDPELVDKLDLTGASSRAGEGKGTSGTGDTQEGGSASSTNVENKSLLLGDDEKDE